MRTDLHLFICLPFSSGLKKNIVYLVLFLSCFANFSPLCAQASNGNTSFFTPSSAEAAPLLGGVPPGSLVLMADGTEKKIEAIQPGDLVATFDPVLEDYLVSRVTSLQRYEVQVQPVATVMLILEELSASIQMKGGLAGVSLVATPTCEVLTKNGPKQIWQLTDNDILYCYDEAAHRFLPFMVYEVEMSEKPAPQAMYSLFTEERNCIINSTVVLQREQ